MADEERDSFGPIYRTPEKPPKEPTPFWRFMKGIDRFYNRTLPILLTLVVLAALVGLIVARALELGR